MRKKCKKFKKTFLEELDTIRKLIQEKIPDFDVRNLHKILGKLGTFHYKKRKGMLLGNERRLYNLLIENSYNPFTVYRWVLLEKVPDDIRFQLKNHLLSQKKASRMFFERRNETEISLQMEIKELGLRLIKGM